MTDHYDEQRRRSDAVKPTAKDLVDAELPERSRLLIEAINGLRDEIHDLNTHGTAFDQTNRKWLRRAYVMVFVLAVIIVTLVYTTGDANRAYTTAQTAHLAVIDRCESGNKFKAEDQAFWTTQFLPLLVNDDPSALTGTSKVHYAQAIKDVKVKDKLTDCNHIKPPSK
jgi:hypothetical protein